MPLPLLEERVARSTTRCGGRNSSVLRLTLKLHCYTWYCSCFLCLHFCCDDLGVRLHFCYRRGVSVDRLRIFQYRSGLNYKV